MRLITMYKRVGEAKLELYGCPIGCRFCAHKSREKRDVPLDQVIKFFSEYETKRVFIGGAEPAMQKRELLELMKALRKRGKEITLKTVGTDPAFLKDTLGLVHRYIIEVRAPLDDVEAIRRMTSLDEDAAKAHLADLKNSLEVLKGQKVRSMTRVLPTIIDPERMERMGQQLEGYVEEAQLIQFMSGGNDVPFEGSDRPSPPLERMEELGEIMLRHVPVVLLQGDGIDATMKR
ncbi:MAG: radical SAM protein [Methanomassiliicoccales archaeon]|jgi:pyruvate formate lyase activating enzyme|nr:radical SAM protein [Methanomassiliicoccales archaeon]